MTPERETEIRAWAARGYPADAVAMIREVLDALDAARDRAERIDAERRRALEAVATVAGVNQYHPAESFPRAFATDNPFRAAVHEVGKLRARAERAERLCVELLDAYGDDESAGTPYEWRSDGAGRLAIEAMRARVKP